MKKKTSQKCKVIDFKVGKFSENVTLLLWVIQDNYIYFTVKEDTSIQRYNYTPYTFLYPNSLIINRFMCIFCRCIHLHFVNKQIIYTL